MWAAASWIRQPHGSLPRAILWRPPNTLAASLRVGSSAELRFCRSADLQSAWIDVHRARHRCRLQACDTAECNSALLSAGFQPPGSFGRKPTRAESSAELRFCRSADLQSAWIDAHRASHRCRLQACGPAECNSALRQAPASNRWEVLKGNCNGAEGCRSEVAQNSASAVPQTCSLHGCAPASQVDVTLR